MHANHWLRHWLPSFHQVRVLVAIDDNGSRVCLHRDARDVGKGGEPLSPNAFAKSDILVVGCDTVQFVFVLSKGRLGGPATARGCSPVAGKHIRLAEGLARFVCDTSVNNGAISSVYGLIYRLGYALVCLLLPMDLSGFCWPPCFLFTLFHRHLPLPHAQCQCGGFVLVGGPQLAQVSAMASLE